jgi:large subunit ribosomal protein L30
MADKTPAKSAPGNVPGNVKVTLVRSPFGQLHRHRATVRGLGLRRMHQSVVVSDTPEIRGMINASIHLLRVEEA